MEGPVSIKVFRRQKRRQRQMKLMTLIRQPVNMTRHKVEVLVEAGVGVEAGIEAAVIHLISIFPFTPVM